MFFSTAVLAELDHFSSTKLAVRDIAKLFLQLFYF